tara:strand:+ start:412 stop:654 length:243 start_codon:yes stop_codon:yes gene_type:complete
MKNENAQKNHQDKTPIEHQPVLLDENLLDEEGLGAKPPYVMIIIIVASILFSFWKVYMLNQKKPVGDVVAPISEAIKPEQ